jgi:hypothetical protein
MATETDDLDDDVPDLGPDAEATAAERARARSFGDLVDKAMAGRTPPAMAADDRALIETATLIRAGAGHAELGAARRSALVEAALRAAIDRPARTAAAATVVAPPVVAPPVADALAARRSRLRRVAPWAVAALSTTAAAAAALVLWLGRPLPAPPLAAPALPLIQRSRPADAVVGRIPRERAGDAAARIDAIYADRLTGYRERALGAARPAARPGDVR